MDELTAPLLQQRLSAAQTHLGLQTETHMHQEYKTNRALPVVSCSSVNTDHLICQHGLTKRLFHHVPIYQHYTPVLAQHVLELKQQKITPKPYLHFFFQAHMIQIRTE